MPDGQILPLEELLAPISASSEAGVDIRNTDFYAEIRSLRVTEDAAGIVSEGTLEPGQTRVADWPRVIGQCVTALSKNTKDLRIAVWLADALARVHHVSGLLEALRFLIRLLDRYWATLYPRVENYELEERAEWLEQCDELLASNVRGVTITEAGPEYTHTFGQWQRCRHLREKAALAKKVDEAAALRKEADDLQHAIDIAILRTPDAFYASLQSHLVECLSECDRLKLLLQERFAAEYRNADNTIARVMAPGFMHTRTALQECLTFINQILTQRHGTDTAAVQGSKPPAPGAATTSDTPQSRTEAIMQLEKIAQFFQRTEPHSPVAYLVQRAARWGEMSLNDWLAEVVGDSTVLAKIRETLGVAPSDGAKQEQKT